MLLVLWVIRLLNGADTTPGGQGVGFDCVIEFCFFPPSSSFFFFLLFFFGELRGRFFCCGWPLRSRSMSSVPVGSQGFSAHGSPWRPLQENVAVCFCRMCVYLFMWNVNMCACMHLCVCFCVCALVSLSALLCCHLQPDKPKDLSPSELPLSGG